jgi:hypothetical protein
LSISALAFGPASSVLAANQKYEEGGIRLFEIGRVFLGKETIYPMSERFSAV